jgi:hypothetical protein
MTNTVELWGAGALGAGIALVTYAAARLRARRAAHRLARRERDLRTVAGILIADDWRKRLAQRARIVGVGQVRGEVQAVPERANALLPGKVVSVPGSTAYGLAVVAGAQERARLRARVWLDELDAYPCETLSQGSVTGE